MACDCILYTVLRGRMPHKTSRGHQRRTIISGQVVSASYSPGGVMLIIRETMYCKPGKVRPLVEKFVAMSKLMQENGMASMRIMTDVATDRYWTCVAEMEVASLSEFENMMSGMGNASNEVGKKM